MFAEIGDNVLRFHLQLDCFSGIFIAAMYFNQIFLHASKDCRLIVLLVACMAKNDDTFKKTDIWFQHNLFT